MFDPYCPSCSSRVLTGIRQLRSLDNTSRGIVLRFSCHCGGEAVLVTGRLASRPAEVGRRAADAAPPVSSSHAA